MKFVSGQNTPHKIINADFNFKQPLKLISREEQVRKCTICKGQKALISDPLGQFGTLGQHISALDPEWICYFINSAVNALGGEAHPVGKVLTESWGPGVGGRRGEHYS